MDGFEEVKLISQIFSKLSWAENRRVFPGALEEVSAPLRTATKAFDKVEKTLTSTK